MDHAKNRLQATEALFGEVNLEVDAYSHPTTGELDGTIRGGCGNCPCDMSLL